MLFHFLLRREHLFLVERLDWIFRPKTPRTKCAAAVVGGKNWQHQPVPPSQVWHWLLSIRRTHAFHSTKNPARHFGGGLELRPTDNNFFLHGRLFLLLEDADATMRKLSIKFTASQISGQDRRVSDFCSSNEQSFREKSNPTYCGLGVTLRAKASLHLCHSLFW